MKRRLIGLVVAILVVGCGGSPAAQSSSASGTASGSITIYSGLATDITNALVADFEKRNPNIAVTVFQSPIGQLLQKMELEIVSTGRIQADVIWTGDQVSMNQFKARKVIQAYKPKGYDKVPASLRDPDGYWTSSVVLGVYLAYNTQSVSSAQVPRSWLDLTNPTWKGKIALSDPAVSGTAAVLTEAMVQKYGWTYWTAVAKNQPKVLPSTVSLVTSVLTGDRPVAPLVDFTAFPSIQKGDPMGVVVPTEGVPTTQIISAITAKTANLPAAKVMVDYLESTDAAAIISAKGFYSARTDVAPPQGMKPLSEVKLFPFDWEKYASDAADLADHFHSVMS